MINYFNVKDLGIKRESITQFAAGLLFLSSIFFSCKKDSDDLRAPNMPAKTWLDEPVSLNLYPGQNTQATSRRVYIPITQMGTKAVNLRTVFDTGSDGIVLQAKSILPMTLLADTGIVLAGKDSLVVDGITITSKKKRIAYGLGKNLRYYYGNIALSTITVGDSHGQVTTLRMPYLLVYKGEDVSTKKAVEVDARSDGVTGVYSTGDPLPLTSSVSDRIQGPFSFLDVRNGLHAGFVLSSLNNINWANIRDYTSAAGVSLLKVGIQPSSDLTGYILHPQRTNGSRTGYRAVILGQFSSPVLSGPFEAEVLFDTGTPQGNGIFAPNIVSSITIPKNSPLTFTSSYGYSYTLTNSNAEQVIAPGDNMVSVMGIDFFLTNAFLIDYTTHSIGIKAASGTTTANSGIKNASGIKVASKVFYPANDPER